MKFRHLIDVDGEIEEVRHRAGGVVHTGETEADRLDVDGETVGEAGEGAFLRDVHLLPAEDPADERRSEKMEIGAAAGLTAQT